MKLIKSLIAGITVCCLVCASVATVSATTSTLNVTTSGGSAYTSYDDYGTVYGANHSSGSAKLVEFKFNGWGLNSMPYDSQGEYYRINTRLYTRSLSTDVSEVAHFNCANQTRGMSYYSGYGTVGAQYRLKTNSSYYATYYAKFNWYV